MRRNLLAAAGVAAALAVGLVAMPDQHATAPREAAAAAAADPAMDPSAPMPFVGQEKVHAVLASMPRPATAYGTQNVYVRNYSHAACGAIGVSQAGWSGLGPQDRLYPGQNKWVASFYSGGPLVDVYQWAGAAVGFRYVGTFGFGTHPFGPGSYYLSRRGC